MAGELRIIGGVFARRRIRVPSAADAGLVRPTSDKVREAIFSALGRRIEDTTVLDVFAGSGALGLEALSRGARRATFIEKDRRTAGTLRENLAALGVVDRCDVRIEPASTALRRLGEQGQTYDVVFCDPPYAVPLDEALSAGLASVLGPGAVLVLERGKKSQETVPGLSLRRERVYGDTRVAFFDKSIEMSTVAIYPGSFDPITNGHLDIVQRGLRTFDRVIFAVANNVQKKPLFTIDERLRLARECLGHLEGVEVDSFNGLVVDYARKKGVRVLLRGLRAVSDFEYEFQLASMNRKLSGEVDTVFMMTSEESFYLSSRLVREVASFGGDVSSMVPRPVYDALQRAFASSAVEDARGGAPPAGKPLSGDPGAIAQTSSNPKKASDRKR